MRIPRNNLAFPVKRCYDSAPQAGTWHMHTHKSTRKARSIHAPAQKHKPQSVAGTQRDVSRITPPSKRLCKLNLKYVKPIFGEYVLLTRRRNRRTVMVRCGVHYKPLRFRRFFDFPLCQVVCMVIWCVWLVHSWWTADCTLVLPSATQPLLLWLNALPATQSAVALILSDC